MIRLADYVMKRLAEEGIRDLFYVSGGQCFYLTDALRRSAEIRGVAMHHEQAVAMAALAYADYRNGLGAGLVTTGCAGTNTLTGVLHAWQDSIPLIIVSGQQVYDQTIKASGLPLRNVGIQEADIETLVQPITKYAHTLEKAEDIAWHLDKAIHLATTGRKGPVWIDIPMNLQNTMVEETKLRRFEADDTIPAASDAEIQQVLDALRQAKRPVFLAGNGIRYAFAEKDFRTFIERCALPAVFSRKSYDFLPYAHPFNFGAVGGVAGANRYANFILQNADLVLSVGNRLSIETTGPQRDQFAREAKTIVVDIDEVEHKKNGVKIDQLIISDAKQFLRALNQCELPQTDRAWSEKCEHWRTIFPYNPNENPEDGMIDMKLFMRRLSEAAPEKSNYISDAGLTGAAAPAATCLKEGERFVIALSQGEMGFALPGACGIAALNGGPVIAYEGDGSFMMNLQELQTIVRNQFNIKIILINNNGYSGVRHGQKAHFRGKTIGTDPTNGLDFPDFRKIAEAFGIRVVRINNLAEIDDGLRAVFADNAPIICEVMCDPEQVDLHNALVTYGKRKFGFRPIEDQSPFIDRDTFFKEMIVEPLETSSGTPV